MKYEDFLALVAGLLLTVSFVLGGYSVSALTAIVVSTFAALRLFSPAAKERIDESVTVVALLLLVASCAALLEIVSAA